MLVPPDVNGPDTQTTDNIPTQEQRYKGEGWETVSCKCIMHLLSHHVPTGAWYFVDIISSDIIVIAYTSGMRPYRRIPR